MSALWVITYDITNNKIRKAVHDQLNNHGQRVQFSVFECRLDQKQQQSLRCTLQALIEDDDKLRWYPLCHWCETDINWQGQGRTPETDDFYLI